MPWRTYNTQFPFNPSSAATGLVWDAKANNMTTVALVPCVWRWFWIEKYLLKYRYFVTKIGSQVPTKHQSLNKPVNTQGLNLNAETECIL